MLTAAVELSLDREGEEFVGEAMDGDAFAGEGELAAGDGDEVTFPPAELDWPADEAAVGPLEPVAKVSSGDVYGEAAAVVSSADGQVPGRALTAVMFCIWRLMMSMVDASSSETLNGSSLAMPTV